MTNSSSPEPVDLSDPSISPHRLQELAQSHPERWDEILDHPNVYPGLADWIRTRQAELAAIGGEEPVEEASVSEDTDDATQVFDASQLAEQQADVEAQDAAGEAETSQAELPQESPSADPNVAATQQPWAMPNPSYNSQPVDSPTAGAAPWTQAEQPTGQQHSGYHQETQQPGQQQQFGYPQYGSAQSYGQPGQFGPPQQFGQPQSYTNRSGASRIDVSSSRTWGLFIAGGAAFLSLFGFIFSPGLQYNVPFASHLASGGWVVLLLFMATVALSLLQLLKPSAWMRFFFIVVSLGAGFAMLGRAITLIGFFTMRSTSFSVLWLMFMSLVLLAGALMYLAPKATDNVPGQPPTGQQGYPTAPHQSGQVPPSGYGQQPPNYPQYPSGPQSYGGYPPGGPQR